MSMTCCSHCLSGLRPAMSIGRVMFSRRGQRRQQVERLEDEADLVPAQLGQLLVLERAELGLADAYGPGS